MMSGVIRASCGTEILVSPEDVEWLSQYAWHIKKSSDTLFYARTCSIGRRWKRMHRLILDLQDTSLFVDHINGNGLDNRRENLRVVTPKENARHRTKPSIKNTSGYRGVYFAKDKGKWFAAIRFEGKVRKLGYFPGPKEAALAFNKAAIELRGQFTGRLNDV